MAKNLYSQLTALKQQVAILESELAKKNRRLLVLPAKHGFRSMNEFIAALEAASGGATASKASNVKVSGSQRKPRAKITPEIKKRLKELVKAGKTGGEIAKTLGISLPSVQNIKKELGLVKGRKK